MNAIGTASQASAVRRWALLFTVLGVALIGTVIGGWVQRGGAVAHFPATSTAVLLTLATLAILIALTLVRRGVAETDDSGLRDAATGLYSASYVAETVANLLARDDRSGRSQLALVCIRVDYLDEIRRRFGRNGVNEMLRIAGRQVRSQTREGDLPHAVEGGFDVYLQCDELEQAEAFCRRLAMLLAREQIELRGDIVKAATHMGSAMRECGEPVMVLRERAMSALTERSAVARGA